MDGKNWDDTSTSDVSRTIRASNRVWRSCGRRRGPEREWKICLLPSNEAFDAAAPPLGRDLIWPFTIFVVETMRDKWFNKECRALPQRRCSSDNQTKDKKS